MSDALVVGVSALHVGFFFMESVFWMTPTVRGIFRNREEKAKTTRVLALNQGVYNLGTAALLMFFRHSANEAAVDAVLGFVIAMGIVGALTASRAIFVVHSVPAILALALRRQ